MAGAIAVETGVESWASVSELARIWGKGRRTAVRIAAAARVRRQVYPGVPARYSLSDAERVRVGASANLREGGEVGSTRGRARGAAVPVGAAV